MCNYNLVYSIVNEECAFCTKKATHIHSFSKLFEVGTRFVCTEHSKTVKGGIIR